QKISLLFLCSRNFKALLHKKHNNTLKSNRESCSRSRRACKFADHLIITATASYASGKSINRNFKNRSCIVRHTSYQSRIKFQCKVRSFCLHYTLDDRSQVICHFRVQKSLQFFFAVFYSIYSGSHGLKELQIFFHALLCKARLFQFRCNAFHTDLVHLIQDNKHLSKGILRESAVGSHSLQDPSVVDADGEAVKIQFSYKSRSCQDHIDLSQESRVTQNINITLHKLTEPASLGA